MALLSSAGAKHPLDALLPPALSARLQARARIVRARPGQNIVGLGSLSTEVYFLLDGTAQVSLLSHAGREVIIRTIGPGTLFGEIAAIDEGPRSAAITAITSAELAVCPGQQFREALDEVPGAGLWIARHLARQVRSLTEKVFELNVLAVRTRLHCELLRLCIDAGCDGPSCIIQRAPTHAELAARIGTHREAVTRELRYLASKRIVEQQRPRLTILDVPALAQIVHAEAGELDVVTLIRRDVARER
jgi:CRP/FNR family transcriptional regulator, cyclic AMP receptor protein